MRILVTNDDGIDAAGIKILEKLAYEITDDVWVVAPYEQKSGAGHSMTIHKPINVDKINSKKFAVHGTPTDCVVAAVKMLIQDKKPDLVLSGVNQGSNLGEDVTCSGTIAAAMEATLHEIKAIAFSQALTPEKSIKWDVAEKFTGEIIDKMLQIGFVEHSLISVNFPSCSIEEVQGMKSVAQGRRRLGDNIDAHRDSEGNTYYIIGSRRNYEKDPEHSDFAYVRDNYIAITPISLDLTDYPFLEKLRAYY